MQTSFMQGRNVFVCQILSATLSVSEDGNVNYYLNGLLNLLNPSNYRKP